MPAAPTVDLLRSQDCNYPWTSALVEGPTESLETYLLTEIEIKDKKNLKFEKNTDFVTGTDFTQIYEMFLTSAKFKHKTNLNHKYNPNYNLNCGHSSVTHCAALYNTMLCIFPQI